MVIVKPALKLGILVSLLGFFVSKFNLMEDIEESSPKQIFLQNHVFSVFVGLQNDYFNKTMVSVYLLVHQNKYLTRVSVYFVVYKNKFVLANNAF